jgi:Fur family iron response transcriptional regulator
METLHHRLPVARAEIPALLEQHGILPTSQRVEIATILLSRKDHWSAEQVLARLHNEEAAVSKATVYNTLNLFADKGIIRQVIVDPTKIFFDSNTDPHYHFYDADTGMIADVLDEEFPLTHLPELPTGMVLERVDVILRVRAQPTP